MSERSRSRSPSRSPSRSRSVKVLSTKGIIDKEFLKILPTIQNHPELKQKYPDEDTRRKYILKALEEVLEELPEGSPRMDLYDKVMNKLFPPEHVKHAAAMKAAEKAREATQKEVNERYNIPPNRAGRPRTQKRPTAHRRVRRGSSKARKARTTRRK